MNLLYNVFVNEVFVGRVWMAMGESANPRLPNVRFHLVMTMVSAPGALPMVFAVNS